jgi:hypothetical protein
LVTVRTPAAGMWFEMRTFEMPSDHCLGCGRRIDLASTGKGREPRAGDLTVCYECGHLMRFDENCKLRDLSVDETLRVMRDPKIRRLLKLRAAYARYLNKEIPEPEGEYSVYQFFPDESYERVSEFVSGEKATNVAKICCTSMGARLGITRRVIITDGGDVTVFEWQHGKGITYPPRPAS